MDGSPTKRRALATLDTNKLSSATLAQSPASRGVQKLKSFTVTAEPSGALSAKLEPDTRKRGMGSSGDDQGRRQAKRTRPSLSQEQNDTGGATAKVQSPVLQASQPHNRARSDSPDDDSVFECSALDHSQATNITEPDIEAETLSSVPRPRISSMTRQEAREKAEILRLRLGLASYKVRTGQTDVPLDQLQHRPLPGNCPAAVPKTTLPASDPRSVADQQPLRATASLSSSKPVIHHRHPSSEGNASVPQLSNTSSRLTLGRPSIDDAGSTSSALKGGAVTGLLSLSRN